MARKRLIAPEFFTHGDLYDAEAQSGMPLRIAFAGLWTQCDRRGLFRWRPRELKLAVLPYDNVDFSDVLNTLANYGFVVRYEVDGKEYGRVPSFGQWQSFHPHEKGAADIPDPATVGPEPTEGGPVPDNDGPSRSAVTPITAVTTAATPTTKTTTPDVSPKAASRRPGKADPENPPSKSKPEPKYPHYPVELCQRLHAKWELEIGLIPYPAWRKRTAEVFNRPGFAESETPEIFEESIVVFWAMRDAEPEKERRWYTPERWWGDLPRLLDLARMPMVGPDGMPTAKYALAFAGH